ncbi:MAG: ribose 5-phosphate isomerase B [Ignavibacteria bacterium]|nr:ribose 5-phosphate isomerase B [Ignavibacteria bacterium]MBI3766052.1 ribose 5-phosphate isomerase B [Ignavibacteriales bacterium]
MSKKLISEQDILEAAKRGEKIIRLEEGVIITDAAKDRAKQLGVKLEKKLTPEPQNIPPSRPPSQAGQKEILAIGSDHGGFQLKEALKRFLGTHSHNVVDLGTYSEEPCDYPDFAYAVARMVSLGEASRGIMIDSVGIASAIVANKVQGIRAACCYDEFSARSSREHNNANVLTLGGKTLGVELAKGIVTVWLETNFGGGRHQKRLDKISDIEKRLNK